MNAFTIPLENHEKPLHFIPLYDSIENDTLFMVSNSSNIPYYFFKNLNTDVCLDKECHLLKSTVFWNITGRYLGFELPEGEFLSKYDHEPFSIDEYEKLHKLLDNPKLPLKNLSVEKLTQGITNQADSVDGITQATSKSLSESVVKGAAYTTIKLWTTLYGPSGERVVQKTLSLLSTSLMNLILNSPDVCDKIWALENIDSELIFDDELIQTYAELIVGDDFSLSYLALNSIKPTHLNNSKLQLKLISIFENANYSVKDLILDKINEAENLDEKVVEYSRSLLPKLNGKQLGDMLYLYEKHKIFEQETTKLIAELLDSPNSFISKQAYNFLKKDEALDGSIKNKIKIYEGGL